MKKIYSIILLATALLSFFAISTGCKKVNDDLVALEAFGPCPVLRGSTITFLGANLDKVNTIIFPNNVEVTEITRTSASEINVIVPQEATEGKIILNYGGGSITTTSNISYTEPYEISSIAPIDVAIRQGDVVTIKGDYLWNIVSVVFMSGAEVDSSLFVKQERKEIQVPVPIDAQSGKIKIVDAAGNELYSDQEVNVLQPLVTSISPIEVKAGNALTLTGTNIDLIESVTFPSGKEVVIELDGRSKTSVSVIVPADAQDGAVSYKSYAEISKTVSTPIILTVPTNLSVTASSDYKAGKTITISGDNLDLVTGLSYAGGVEGSFVYADGTITSTIENTAVDGAITLTCASTKTVETPAITLVKPVITSLNPLSLTAGETFKVIGTDLDLVSSLTLGGKDCAFTVDSQTQITVTTENTSVSGKVAVKAANGDAAESTDEITLSYNSRVIVNSLPSVASAGDEITMTGENFNMIESIFFGSTKVTGYSKREDTEMVFVIPANTDTGNYNIQFLLTTGETENCPASIEVKGATITVVEWEGSHNVGTAWSNAFTALSWGNYFKKLPYGAALHIEYITNSSESSAFQLQIMNGNWSSLQCVPVNEWNVHEVAEGSSHVQFDLTTQDVLDLYNTGLVLSGVGVTYTKVYYTYENKGKEPSRPSDIILVDYETHGDHDGSWDGSWNGCSELITEADGNHYINLTSSPTGAWIVNCNHQSNTDLVFTVTGIENYDICYDVLVPAGWSDPGDIMYQIVLGDSWNWFGANMFSSLVGNGKWQTVKISASALGLSGDKDFSAGTNGLFIDGSSAQGLPVGMGIDNMRLIKK